MTILSVLRSTQVASPSGFIRLCLGTAAPAKGNVQAVGNFSRALSTSLVQCGGHGPRTMVILPSRYQWQKYKDSLHFYLFLGAIPALAIVFLTNVFIGPATLSEIPCGYTPKHWEYHKHPISRFMSRYMLVSPQESYERNLHYIMEADEARRMRRLAAKIEKLMSERGDYPNFYYSKINMGKYIRGTAQEKEYIESIRGDE